MTSAESITPGSTGLGVGVGFGFQSGGGGGRSFVPCARAVGTDMKMASTPNRNTGHKVFSAPKIIIGTLEPVSHVVICRVDMFSYPTAPRLFGAMLDARSCTQSELRAVQLISGARGARVHRRRWSGQAL